MGCTSAIMPRLASELPRKGRGVHGSGFPLRQFSSESDFMRTPVSRSESYSRAPPCISVSIPILAVGICTNSYSDYHGYTTPCRNFLHSRSSSQRYSTRILTRLVVDTTPISVVPNQDGRGARRVAVAAAHRVGAGGKHAAGARTTSSSANT